MVLASGCSNHFSETDKALSELNGTPRSPASPTGFRLQSTAPVGAVGLARSIRDPEVKARLGYLLTSSWHYDLDLYTNPLYHNLEP
ncbi:DUF1641 domain-containing protein [Halalkalirubrum salinum]|uniref:DUF1641 domain-containing protein n=1 Tax=Halalkalirubrum salinum TaxID=2563889 RepID=UPI00223939DD|nr:DUF1641 domain-containing protein [Halalkalirubrum salinum]